MNPSNSYFDQYVLTADPATLVRLLLQKASSHVSNARIALHDGDIGARGASVMKAYEILLELIGSLDDQHEPVLCGRLRALYLYMQERLLEANTKQQAAPLDEVQGLLETLASAWVASVTPTPTNAISHAAQVQETLRGVHYYAA